MENNNYNFREKNERDNDWIKKIASEQWGSNKIISKDKIYDVLKLPGFVAENDQNLIGVILFSFENKQSEIVALFSAVENKGIGTKLINLATEVSRKNGCEKIWLMTTNDNTEALKFYQKRGFVLSAIRTNVMQEQRRIKPSIPFVGNNGIPIRDEIELEMSLKEV